MKTAIIEENVSPVMKWNPHKEAANREITYIEISSISRDLKKVMNESEIFGNEAPGGARQLVSQGDVLVSQVRPNLNSVALVPKHLDGATASTGLCVLRPIKDRLDNRYLFHWVRSPKFVASMTKQATGQCYPTVSDKIIKSSKIPLPSLEEQKRIVKILDKVDDMRCSREKFITKLNCLVQSIFYSMFGDPVTNPNRWPMGTIGDMLAEVQYGTSKKAHTETRGIPILRIGNVTYGGEINLDNLKYVELKENEIEKYTVRRGDILFNRTNSKDLVGKTAIYNSREPMVIAGYLIRARVNDRADPYYIGTYMNSKHGKATLQNMCKNIVGMANINAQEFQNISIAIPPIELQRNYRNRIEKISDIKNSSKQFNNSLKYLFASIQQRAFRGEI